YLYLALRADGLSPVPSRRRIVEGMV
ncbi:uncharacterized protein METZ01_LOCUS483026, partial [marine metagenome]